MITRYYKIGKKIKIYHIYNYIIFCMDGAYNCVKHLSAQSFLLKTFSNFLKRKLYALVWIPLETRKNFNKTKILNKYFA